MTYEQEMKERLKLLGEWLIRQDNNNVHATIRLLKRKLEKLDIVIDE